MPASVPGRVVIFACAQLDLTTASHFQGCRRASTHGQWQGLRDRLRGTISRRSPRLEKSQMLSIRCVRKLSRPFPSACGHKKLLSSVLYLQILSLLGRIRCWPCRTGPYGTSSYLPTPLTFCSYGL